MFEFEIGESVECVVWGGKGFGVITKRRKCGEDNFYTVSFNDGTHFMNDVLENHLLKIPGTDTNVGTKEELHIKDSGSRTEYSTGAVRDVKVGKGRCDLLPLDVVGNILTGHSSTILNCINDFKRGSDERLQTAILEFCAEREWSKEEMLLEVSKHFEEGAEKYGEYNWQKGIPIHSYIDSAIRHYLKYKAGWKDERHDRAFVWNILCCLWTMRHAPEMDDYTDLKELNPEGGWEDK